MQTADHNHQQHAPDVLPQPPVGPEKLSEIRHIISVGCGKGGAASQVTLRHGLELMVKRVVSEIKEIVDATEHAAGKQRFYPRYE